MDDQAAQQIPLGAPSTRPNWRPPGVAPVVTAAPGARPAPAADPYYPGVHPQPPYRYPGGPSTETSSGFYSGPPADYSARCLCQRMYR